MQGFADGHIVGIEHGHQEEKHSHTQDNKKKKLNGTKIIGNCIVPRGKHIQVSGNTESVKRDF